ncbi:protein kinase domain-containing protein [Alicyclobacillus dauci]|uniref:Phosphotransferase n=1 Tax=Alicyclobacillus dauci TaxID=1475485 RepID=A0ABY6Z391_9BACL|nr:phosphotransferase [Alicyclobacillus dauci]WAH37347.1 phosphotransferase [Alicyclobacillus dauci]
MMLSAQVPLSRGLRITGKWTKNEWTVLSCLGIGANGAVYSVRQQGGEQVAMKVCSDAGAVAFEWGLLERMAKAGTAFPKPHCIDDSANQSALYFYVMEQVGGRPLIEAWPRLSTRDAVRVLIGIGYGLRDLHASGHAFCDIKPQNVLVDVGKTQCVRFVDVGGVTPFGRSVRQFTPTSDCAYWGFGERRASAAYDIAAVMLTVTCLQSPPPPNLSQWTVERRKAWLQRAVRATGDSAWRGLAEDAIQGKLQAADEFIRRLYVLAKYPPAPQQPRRAATSSSGGRRMTSVPPSTAMSGAKSGHMGQTSAIPKRTRNRQAARAGGDWTERFMWISLTCAIVSTAGAWAVYFRWL